jgi:4-hydroxythreonine-4-phosphate dehydrogenase
MVLRLALTSGEPAGIGPDLCVQLAQQAHPHQLVVIGSPDVFKERAEALNLPLTLRPFDDAQPASPCAPGELFIETCHIAEPVIAGKLNPANAAYVLQTLDIAADGCAHNRFDAMITAPLHKGVINDAGVKFSGHTEYLAEKSGANPVMLLAAGNFRVALATTHLPLSQVASAINKDQLVRVLTVLHDELVQKFHIAKPTILVCGLNPHAGEDGHLGTEEIDIIIPTVNELKDQGLSLIGPLPADTLFTPHHLSDADAVLAMYHDQGLPVLKYAGFGQAVNVTLGLPIIRTSVDHGTALDKAATGNINSGSLHAAIEMAATMAATPS